MSLNWSTEKVKYFKDHPDDGGEGGGLWGIDAVDSWGE